MTNWDKMKKMNIEEIAKMIAHECPQGGEVNCDKITCKECWERWLKTDVILKSCPFCGKNAARVQKLSESDTYAVDLLCNPDYYEVICDHHDGGCGTALGGEYETEEEAIEKWNTRAKII